MNREYAYNRDNGKCKCCKTPLFLDDKKYCYHIKGELPLDKVNKKENEIVGGEPDEGEPVGGRKEKSYER